MFVVVVLVICFVGCVFVLFCLLYRVVGYVGVSVLLVGCVLIVCG